MERVANRIEFFGLAHYGEYTKRYWITVAMAIRARRVLGDDVDISVTGDTFSRCHFDREPKEIKVLLDAAIDLLLMFLESNAYGNPVRDGRCKDLSMSMVYHSAREAHPELYHDVSYAVTYSYQNQWSSETTEWQHQFRQLECLPYLDREMIGQMLLNKNRMEELTSHVFYRELILTRMKLFQKVKHFSLFDFS